MIANKLGHLGTGTLDLSVINHVWVHVKNSMRLLAIIE